MGRNRPEPDTGPPEPVADGADRERPEGRPFYERFGWAYDLLVDDPVEPWVDAVEEVLPTRPARILDAGCGTGRHAAELARRGHEPVLADAAAPLLDQARQRLPGAEAFLGDLAELHLDTTVDAITCRGVLNDVLDDAARDRVLAALARALAPGGVLVVDVRELTATAARYGEPTTRTRTLGDLRFSTSVRLEGRLLRIHERHERGGDVAEQDVSVRPWTREELRERLTKAGLGRIELRPGVPEERSDRLFVVARRP